jgi:hypothetical protein
MSARDESRFSPNMTLRREKTRSHDAELGDIENTIRAALLHSQQTIVQRSSRVAGGGRAGSQSCVRGVPEGGSPSSARRSSASSAPCVPTSSASSSRLLRPLSLLSQRRLRVRTLCISGEARTCDGADHCESSQLRGLRRADERKGHEQRGAGDLQSCCRWPLLWRARRERTPPPPRPAALFLLLQYAI